MIRERIRLGRDLILPRSWMDVIGADEGDELTVLYDERGILIAGQTTKAKLLWSAFSDEESVHQAYMTRMAEQAAFYENSPLVRWAAEYAGKADVMSPQLEAIYLEGEAEILASHLPPLQSGLQIELEKGVEERRDNDGSDEETV